METLRCPTCLGVLPDGGQKRCPSCRTRLGARGRPIVLGESNQLSAQPAPPESEPPVAAAAQRVPHPRRARRLVAAKPRVDELPRFDTKIVFVPEAVEALVLEPEPEPDARVAEPQVAAASVVETKIVFVPETVAAVVAPREVVIPEVVADDEVAARTGEPPDAGSQLFSAAARKPRVKKIAKRRRGWEVDYVVPESESGDADA
ncbi:MAG: hypothetical protein QOI44_218 [Actinomycetota bacterium]|nr:hypothetical protein [Actinomycetota bacterium]